jgi:hypothetical protein
MDQVSGLIYKVLGSRQRIRQQTDLTQLYRQIKKLDKTVDEKSFLATFRKLELDGAGSLVIGRRGNPNRFVWKYNLKDVATRLNKNKSIDDLKPLEETNSRLVQFTKPARKMAIVKPKELKRTIQRQAAAVQAKPMLQIVINIPEGTNKNDVQAYIDLAKDLGQKK